MNYIELINNFWELDETWQFTCCETRLYFYLLKTANRLGWVDNWTHSVNKLAANVGVSENSVRASRNRLVQAGLISITKGGNGQRDKNRHQILNPKQHPKLDPKQHPKLDPKADDTLLDEINQTKRIKKNKQKKEFDFEKILVEVHECNPKHVSDWLRVRKEKKAANTETALNAVVDECKKHNFPIADAVKICAEKSWQGFKVEWINKQNNYGKDNTGIFVGAQKYEASTI